MNAPFDLAGFYARCASRFEEAVTRLDGEDREAMRRYRVAPFASDPVVSLRHNPLYVVSMKPYAQAGRRYPFGWDERATRPGLHRWLDGPRRHSNFCREAVALVREVQAALGEETNVRTVPNTYATVFRAEDAAQLKRWGLAHVDCSALHRELLAVVRPRVVLCVGNGPAPSAFAMLQRVTGVAAADVTATPVAPRTYVKHFTAVPPWSDGPVLVLGVPHLSYVRAASLLAEVRRLVAAA